MFIEPYWNILLLLYRSSNIKSNALKKMPTTNSKVPYSDNLLNAHQIFNVLFPSKNEEKNISTSSKSF